MGLSLLLLPVPVGNPLREEVMERTCARVPCWRFGFCDPFPTAAPSIDILQGVQGKPWVLYSDSQGETLNGSVKVCIGSHFLE